MGICDCTVMLLYVPLEMDRDEIGSTFLLRGQAAVSLDNGELFVLEADLVVSVAP